MDELEKTVIVDTKIIDNFIESSKNAEHWRQELRKAQKQGKEYEGDVNRVARELAKANNQFREAKKVIESSERAEQLLNTTADDTVKTLGEMQRELTALRSVPLNILPEEKAVEVKQRMADLMATIGDVKAEIKGMDTGAVWENTASSLQFITSGAQLLGQTLDSLGVESEWAEKLQSSTLELIGATQALATITDLLGQKKLKQLAVNLKTIKSNITEAVTVKATALQTKGAAVAENLLTAAKGKGVVATKAATAAAWLLNKALAVNPVVLAAAAVVALAAGLWKLTSAFSASKTAAKEAEAANRQYEKQTLITEEALADINRKREQAAHDASLAGRQQIEALKKNGASKERIAKAEYEMNTKVRDAEYKALIRNRGELKIQVQDAEENLRIQEKRLKQLDRESKKWNEQKQVVDQVRQSLRHYNDLYAAAGRDVEKTLQDQADAELAYRKEVSDATYDLLIKQVDQQKAVDESRLKAEAGYQSQDFRKKAEYAAKLQELAAQAELRKLTVARNYGKITEAEYRARLRVLNNAYREFANDQARQYNEYFKQQRDDILSLYDSSAQEQIDAVNRKFEAAYRKLEEQGRNAPDASAYEGGTDSEEYRKAQKEYEAFMYNIGEIRYKLFKQQSDEIDAINKSNLAKRHAQIERDIHELYADDLSKWQSNERKKTEIAIRELQAQIEAKKAAGLDVYDEEAALLTARSALNRMNLDSELLAAEENARARYEARKKYLEEEMALAEGDHARQMELHQEALDNEREYFDARIAAVERWAGASQQALSAVNDLFNALDEARLQKVQENYDRESELLKEKLDSGAISQAEYDKKQKQLDKDLEKEQAKIARQQAIREKAMAIFQILLNTAMGVMKAVAASPLTGGLPWSAIVGALGAVQLAAVAAQPLPKAARGRYIEGRSHAQGGELVVAEDGEIIMNKNSVRLFGPELSAMSVAGGGVPFTNHIPDGGYTARYATAGTMSSHEMQQAMRKAMKSVRVVATIEDIRRGEAKYAEVESHGVVAG